jgi:hypothetical protein
VSLQAGLRARHLVATFLEGARHRCQVLRPAGGVVGAVGPLVRVDRAPVALPRLRVNAGHLHVEVEGADVVGEREHVLLSDRLAGRERLAVPARAASPLSSTLLPARNWPPTTTAYVPRRSSDRASSSTI